MVSTPQSRADSMTRARSSEILRRIVPWALESSIAPPTRVTTAAANYKGVRGRIGIVGGARDYAGAPYFASMAALRLGADLSYVICSSAASQAIKNYSPDLIVMPLLDCPSESEFLNEIQCLLSRLHALVIGPGLGREKLLQSRAKKLIAEAKARSIPLVLDADSLILVNDDPSIIKSYSQALLTPNRIELQRLSNSLFAPKTFDISNMQTKELEQLVRQCSSLLDVSILAKGMVDIINSGVGGCDTKETIQVKTDEHLGSNRRCGGQGDLLSGMAGVYLHWINEANRREKVEEFKIEHPTVWAGYLAAMTTRHCNAIAYKEFRNGMLASNMIDRVHLAFDAMLSSTNENKPELDNRQRPLSQPAGAGRSLGEGGHVRNAKYTGLLTKDEISRYKRQMIMTEFGPERQLKLRKASAIIIGAGGLGCPAAVYLGAGGIGRLGIVDDDLVEASNLHRQILHNLNKIGMQKTDSIKEAILAINPNVEVETHSVKMTRNNAVELIESYDVVIDATDNLKTRYMISDACVVAKKPLVSGAALKMDGQLTVYNYDAETPCFRCLFPEPPPPNAVGSCSDNGVLGVIPGIIGVHQALETMKIGAGLRPAYARKMLFFDGQLGLFRQATLAKRKSDCQACGPNSKLGRNLIDYDELCETVCKQKGKQGSAGTNNILEPNERVSNEQYRDLLESNEPHVLVDVRPLAHSSVSRFEHAIPLPVVKLLEDPSGSIKQIKEALESKNTNQIYVVCRLGIASQRGTRIIQDLLENPDPSNDDHHHKSANIVVKDIIGGMTAWAERIDPSFSCL